MVRFHVFAWYVGGGGAGGRALSPRRRHSPVGRVIILLSSSMRAGLAVGLGYVRRPTSWPRLTWRAERPSANSAAAAAVGIVVEAANTSTPRIVKSAFRLVDVTFFPYKLTVFPTRPTPFLGTHCIGSCCCCCYTRALGTPKTPRVKPRPRYR